MNNIKEKRRIYIWAFALFFIIAFNVAFVVGKYPVSIVDVVKILLAQILPINQTWAPHLENIVLEIRLPRIIMAAIIGAGLSVAGGAFQSVFQNPIVSSDILGASSGSAFGAALAILLGLGYKAVSLSAFLFGISSIIIVYIISSRVKNNPTLGLILGGMLVTSLFSSGVSFLKLVADPTDILPVITYWLMGSLASITMKDVYFAFPILFIGIVVLYLLRWKLNVLTLGDNDAKTIGVDVPLTKFTVIIAATLITAASVAVSGLIGWVGLIIPHLCRLCVGSDYRYLIPTSIFMGAGFMIAVDCAARTLASSEIPIGILTAFLGAPIFIYLIIKEGGKL